MDEILNEMSPQKESFDYEDGKDTDLKLAKVKSIVDMLEGNRDMDKLVSKYFGS